MHQGISRALARRTKEKVFRCAFLNLAIACETPHSEHLVLRWTMFRSTTIAVIVYGTAACGGGGQTSPPKLATVLASIAVIVSPASIRVGQTATATATGVDQNGAPFTLGTVTWSVSSPSVATITGLGTLVALSPGVVTVLASSGNRTGQASLTITAPVAVAAVAITPTSARITVGQTQQLSAVVTDSANNVVSGEAVTWSSSAPAVVSVTQAGLVTALTRGLATISASLSGVNGRIDVLSVSTIAMSATGATGYLHAAVTAPPASYSYGYSGYTSMSRLGGAQAENEQFGWGTWLIPNNLGFSQALCPVGTYARDNWPERGPSYRDVYQTIEGGGGRWTSTAFPSPSPKFRVNSTPDCYSTEVASTGWSFYLAALPANKLGFAQLSNRLLVPPDGITVAIEPLQALLGFGWIALPLIPATTSPLGVPTGDQNLTLFLNATNFRGPVAFFVPETWSAVHALDRSAVGRGLDAQPLLFGSLALEVGNLPMMTATAASGERYRRVPQVAFGTASFGQAMLLQDVRTYAKSAVWDAINLWVQNGTPTTSINASGSTPTILSNPTSSLRMGNAPIVVDAIMSTGILQTGGGGSGIGITGKVLNVDGQATLPEYFRESNGSWIAIPPTQVPVETGLTTATFTPKARATPATLNAITWNSAAWASPMMTATLNDGSTVDYVWYRFVDQPAIARLGLDSQVLQKLQAFVISLHQNSGVNGVTIAGPTAGRLATLDPGLIVTPPAGLTNGYVPVVIRQR